MGMTTFYEFIYVNTQKIDRQGLCLLSKNIHNYQPLPSAAQVVHIFTCFYITRLKCSCQEEKRSPNCFIKNATRCMNKKGSLTHNGCYPIKGRKRRTPRKFRLTNSHKIDIFQSTIHRVAVQMFLRFQQ